MAAAPALHALKIAGERIPDQAFEKIPFAGPRYFQAEEDSRRRKEKRQQKKQEKEARKSGSGGRSNRNSRDDDRGERSGGERGGYEDDGYDSYDDTADERETERRARRSHRRSERRRDRRDEDDRGYASDGVSSRGATTAAFGYPEQHGGAFPPPPQPRDTQLPPPPMGYNGTPYFPPPPTIAVNEPYQQQPGAPGASAPYQSTDSFTPRPYDPREYGERPGSRDGYYEGHPQEQQPQPFTYPPPPGPPPAGASSPRYANPQEHSTADERYRPSNYDRYDRSISPGSRSLGPDRGQPDPRRSSRGSRSGQNLGYPTAVAVVPPESEYSGYSETLSPTNTPRSSSRHQRRDDDDDRSSYKDRKPRSSSRHSRASSRSAQLKEGFEKHKKQASIGALGAIAGGLLGNEFGGKKGKMGMFIGAAIGGIGGGLYEKRHEDREKRERGSSRGRAKDGYESF